MLLCPSCGQENPEIARFCLACGAALKPETAAAREERKVVTVLFCDLVGSTARAEGADPEDVRALLSAYHERVRSELERFGGTVEKFIGDAVMALFGAPSAHEDDPERAVRAALAIRDWAQEEGDLQVRIGITTGEALVSFSANLQAGEGMASGDVVNTAARLQSGARENAILVDATTYRATDRAIDYGAHEPVEAKGKTEAVPVWEVVQARARLGVDLAQRGAAELVGRKEELDLLASTLARVRREGEPQLVTLVGVPGIGKSRLVYELFNSIATGGDLTYWRQGRALPYGEGVTFWPLVEIAKAHAGILETDTADEAEAKLARAVSEALGDDPDADWVSAHVRPLVGLEADAELGGDRRAEAFAAWRRLFEALAERRPLVLVFEDLQWADDGMLDFVEHLVDWATGVPLLVVCGTRPELLDRRPGWGAGKQNSAIVSLTPLSHDDTARLVHALREQAVLPAEVQSALLARAGGNPLYAEEFVRMAAEAGGEDELPVPESVQGLIAARLDLLPDREKSLLQDAAVVGKVFWLGAVEALGDGNHDSLEQLLHVLERKDFVRRARRSSVAAEREYTFRHVLVHDVAYGQIPRAQRGEKHRLAAEWIASLSPDRSEDRAEMLAHHYLSALELASAAGQRTAELADRGRFALREAGDRALALNAFAAAARFYGGALDLWPDDAERPELLFRSGRALHLASDDRAQEALERARDTQLEHGDRERAAESSSLLAELWWHRGQRERVQEQLDHSLSLVEGEPVSESKARVLAQVSRYLMLAGDLPEAIRVGREAMAMAEALDLVEVQVHALNNVGSARSFSGDSGGIEELERSVELARSSNSPELARALNNLAVVYFDQNADSTRSYELRVEAAATGERFGATPTSNFARAILIMHEFFRGSWKEYAEAAEAYLAESERVGRRYADTWLAASGSFVLLARGEEERAHEQALWSLDLAREAGDPQAVGVALSILAWVETELGRRGEARKRAIEYFQPASPVFWPWLVAFALEADRLEIEQELLAAVEERARPGNGWVPALRLLIAQDYAGAAEALREIGVRPHEAFARLRAAEQLVAQGRHAEADAQLEQSLAFWRAVGATRYIGEGEALLAKTA
jgi:class 3 adenylate cyclase/tetratricopeptide (TPR) repeat protein